MSFIFSTLLFVRFCLDGLEGFHPLYISGTELEVVISDHRRLLVTIGGLVCSSILGVVGPLACHVKTGYGGGGYGGGCISI